MLNFINFLILLLILRNSFLILKILRKNNVLLKNTQVNIKKIFDENRNKEIEKFFNENEVIIDSKSDFIEIKKKCIE